MLIHAKKSDVPIITNILTESFQDNKSVNRSIKQDEKRISRIEHQIKYACKIALKNKLAFINQEKSGVILCSLSNGKRSSIFDDLNYIRKVSGLSLGLQLIKRQKEIKSYHPTEPFVHLWFIGIKTEYQQKGIGTQMIQKLKTFDILKQLPIYLETSNQDNLKFYQKNDFEIFKTKVISTDNFPLYFLRHLPI